ncbi:MAG TPA: hypothetical protein EYP17_02380 [Candidatus Latescibacteria bacterium]|nr:hypothetical protein [Candidatus Latescibacterota bacterium]
MRRGGVLESCPSLPPHRCTLALTVEEFTRQFAEAGIPGAGLRKYCLLMPAAMAFLQDKARNKVYPYSMPPASREYRYSADICPNARDFLENFVRWITFCEKYQPEYCELVAEIVREVADINCL